MDIGIISSRYAKSLLKFAIENGEAELVFQELGTLKRLFVEITELKNALNSPIVTSPQKVDLLTKAAVAEGASCTKSLSRFVQLVVENRRAEFMPFIAEAYITQYRKQKGLIESRLVVASKVSEDMKERLLKIVEDFSEKKVELSTEIDPEIGGGFVLYYDNYRFDASLRSKLNEMRQTLVK